jgi:hypothetical protein
MTNQPNMAPTAPAKDAAIKPDKSAPDPKLEVAAPVGPTAPTEPKKS